MAKRIVVFNMSVINKIPSLRKALITLQGPSQGKIQTRNEKGQFQKESRLELKNTNF